MYKLLNDIETIIIRKKENKSDVNKHLDTFRKLAKECNSIVEVRKEWSDSTWGWLLGHPETILSLEQDYNNKYIEDVRLLERKAKSICIEFNRKNDLILDQNFDLLYLDREYTFLDTVKDLNKYVKYIQKYIVLGKTSLFGYIDSYVTESSTTGLMPAIDYFIADNPSWKVIKYIPYNMGITILKRKE